MALAADALGADVEAFDVLGTDDAVTLAWGDRVVRIGGPKSANGIPIADWADALLEISPVLIAPLGAPLAVDGGTLLVFPRLPTLGVEALDPIGTGAALAAFHEDGTAYLEHVDLPAFDPLALARTWLGRAGDLVPAAIGADLLTAIAATWPAVGGPRTVLHGDAHAANWCADDTGRWRLIDAAYLGAGPATYDLAPLAVVDARLGLGDERSLAFRRAYETVAGPVDDRSLNAAIRVRSLLSALWYAARPGADQAAIRDRLDDLTPPLSHPDS